MKTIYTFLIISILSLNGIAQKAGTSPWYVFNSTNSPLPDNFITALYPESDNNLWIGTTMGVAHYDEGSWSVYNSQNSALTDNEIKGIAIDQQHIIWVTTTSGGLVSINKSSPGSKGSYAYTTSNSGLPVNALTSIVVDNFDNKWIGTWGAGLVKFDGSSWTVYNTQNSPLPSNGITDIYYAANNTLWIGTYNGGIVKYDGTTWTVYNTQNSGIISNFTLSVCADSSNVAWIGTTDGLSRFDGSNWNTYNMSTVGWNIANVNDVCALTSTKFIGTDNGLVIYDSNNWSFKIPSNSGLPAIRVSRISGNQNGNKWIGTYGGGLAIYNENGVSLGLSTVKDNPVSYQLWPIPSEDNISVILEERTGSGFKVIIQNINGQIILEAIAQPGENQVNIDISKLPAGVYIATMENEKSRIAKRFIKS